MSRLHGNSSLNRIENLVSRRNSTADSIGCSQKTYVTWKIYVIAITVFIFYPCIAQASSREKTDIIYMQNGDKITCEIRSLEKGQLTVKPDYTDSTIVIDWTKVEHVESKQDFVVTDPRGDLYTGSITETPQPRLLAVVSATPVTLPHESVIQIEPLGETFLKRLRGDIDLGLSFARSNAQKNLTLQGDLTYQSKAHLFSFNSDSQFTSQQKT